MMNIENLRLNIQKWFHPEWWEYLLQPKGEEEYWFKVINCRRKGHPYPVVWYNTYGYEPDLTCTNCGDDRDGALKPWRICEWLRRRRIRKARNSIGV